MAGPVLDRGIGGLRDKAKRYSVFSLARQAASYHTGWQQAWRHAEPKSEYDAVIIGGGGHERLEFCRPVRHRGHHSMKYRGVFPIPQTSADDCVLVQASVPSG